MKYSPSINIEHNRVDELNYIVTPNSINVLGEIINSFNTGVHSFNIIGSYGTGKSSFILALEKNLIEDTNLIIKNNGQFNGYKSFEFLNIVGDYAPLMKILNDRIDGGDIVESKNFFQIFDKYYNSILDKRKFLFIMLDEFGKILEYASKNNPERELFFLQKFAEYVNNPNRNIILLTTLHQNFSSYAKQLTQEQKNEWTKVKGRFKEVVFNEPVEQLLYLAALRLEKESNENKSTSFKKIYNLAIESRFVSSSIPYDVAEKLYPMDLCAANAMTLAIQRYGQNERTLFTFLEAKGDNSLSTFRNKKDRIFNLADVYDYIIYNFYSYLSEANSDSMNWTAMRVSLERVEGTIDTNLVGNASKLVKTIGLFNLFGTAGIKIDKNRLVSYANLALDIQNAEDIINLLSQFKIIRYAEYKSQYILFEGTDLNLEYEILKSSSIVPKSRDYIEKLRNNFNFRVTPAIACYYRKGTPRYFEYIINDSPIDIEPEGETDGYINLLFSQSNLDSVIHTSKNNENAILYVYFLNTEDIINHIWQLDKYDYILKNIIIDETDKVAIREIGNLIDYERSLLNKAVQKNLFNSSNTIWIYKGERILIDSKVDFNKTLSFICNDIYTNTPRLINELMNKQKPSSAISLARINYLNALLENSEKKLIGFEGDKYPPEKTIYMSLLYNTGIHRKVTGGFYELGRPIDESFIPLWEKSEAFLFSSVESPKKIGEFIKILRSKPFKLKQGFIDFWIPTFLIIKKDDYSLYDSNGTYIPYINREVLDILQKSPSEFTLKAYNVEGLKLDLYNKYREAISLGKEEFVSNSSFVETIRPFITFYKSLNNYAKNTKKFNNDKTRKFRDVIAKAKDPEKTFFEDLPEAMGFRNKSLVENQEFIHRYVELIQGVIRDLRSCYSGLIERIETAVINDLHLKSKDFSLYKKELEQRYSNIKEHLLTNKQKAFFSRIISPMQDKVSWYQSLSYIILDKQLENLLDEEEEYLIDNLLFLFNELTKYVEISENFTQSSDHYYRFELISDSGKISPQIITISTSDEKKRKVLEKEISNLLTGDKNIDVSVLLDILKKKIGNE